MLWKMYTASVDVPLEVRMGGAPLRWRAWKARKIRLKESTR